ncbi:hypothetical protein MAR_031534, partial [Mya arenaria]
MSNVDLENENDPAVPMSMFGVSRKVNLLDKANTSVFGRRLSRNAGGPEEKKGGIETWEDLLNIQRIEYKEEPQPTTIGFQVGVVAKFMRWINGAQTVSRTADGFGDKHGGENEETANLA